MKNTSVLLKTTSALPQNAFVQTETTRTRTLPRAELPRGPTPLTSNHVLVNQARAQCGLESLFRSRELDELARKKAQQLADKAILEETPHQVLVDELKTTGNLVAENVLKGKYMRAIQKLCFQHNAVPRHRKNMFSPEYNEMGMGTARSEVDGNFYMVQYFRFNPELEKP